MSGGTGGGGGGGMATVIVTDAVTPAIVAVNVVAPVAIAVTSPLPSTVATAGCDDVHDTGSPVSACPALSSGVAATVSVCCGWTVTAVAVSAMVAVTAALDVSA